MRTALLSVTRYQPRRRDKYCVCVQLCHPVVAARFVVIVTLASLVTSERDVTVTNRERNVPQRREYVASVLLTVVGLRGFQCFGNGAGRWATTTTTTIKSTTTTP